MRITSNDCEYFTPSIYQYTSPIHQRYMYKQCMGTGPIIGHMGRGEGDSSHTFSRSRWRSSSSVAMRVLVLSKAAYLLSEAANASSASFSLF